MPAKARPTARENKLKRISIEADGNEVKRRKKE